MSGPWEDYKTESSAPWDDFKAPTIGDRAARVAGLGARAVVTGVTGVPTLMANAAQEGINAVSKAVGSDYRMQRPSDVLQRTMTEAGLPEPQNRVENFSTNVAAGLAGLGGQLGVLGRMPSSPTVDMLSAAPGRQAASVLTGGTAADVAANEGGAGFWGQQAAALAGSAIPYRPTQWFNTPNPVREKTIADAKELGYVVPPSASGGGLVSRVLEGLSGKYKTAQLAGIKNQKITDSVVRGDLGLPKDAPLTQDSMRQVRSEAYQQGYAPIANTTTPMMTGPKFDTDLNNIAASVQTGAFNNPAARAVADVVNRFRVRMFDAADAIKEIQLLRDSASDLFKSGDSAVGRANLQLAKALEDQIERQLAMQGKNGAELLKNFRDARRRMAISHTVEDAIKEGSGSVNAATLARDVQGGEPLSGDILKAAKFANTVPSVTRLPQDGDANPLTWFDMTTGGYGMGAGNKWLAAMPAARIAARYGILSAPGQAMIGPTGLTPQQSAAQGILASYYANQ